MEDEHTMIKETKVEELTEAERLHILEYRARKALEKDSPHLHKVVGKIENVITWLVELAATCEPQNKGRWEKVAVAVRDSR